MGTTQVTFKTDPDVKRRAMELYGSMGLDLTTAINMFLRQSLACNGIPFRPSAAPARVDWSRVLRPARTADGVAVLPADWDDLADDAYDEDYAGV